LIMAKRIGHPRLCDKACETNLRYALKGLNPLKNIEETGAY